MEKKARKPKSTFTATEVGAILEDLRGKFQIFGEGQKILNQRVEKVEYILEKVAVQVDKMDLKSSILEIKEGTVEKQLDTVEKKLDEVKKDTEKIKRSVNLHEKRISHLEVSSNK